jgi:hypothetical protein
MPLTKNDLEAVRVVIREERKGFVRRDDLARLTMKEDLLGTARKLEAKLSSKEDLLDTEGRLTKKIELRLRRSPAWWRRKPCGSGNETRNSLATWATRSR